MTSGRYLYRLSAIFLAILALSLSSSQAVWAHTFVGPSAIIIDGTFTDWPAAPPPNPGCYVIQDKSNTGIYDGTGFAGTPADINYFWNAVSTQHGGTENASAANRIQNVYYRVDTFTTSVIRPGQVYNIQLNLGTAAEAYADHLLQIWVLDTATPKVTILLSEYNTPFPRLGAYTSGSIRGKVCNIANPYPGYPGVVDTNAVGAYGKYDATHYGIEIKIPVNWYGSTYGGNVKDDGTGASLFVGTIFTSSGNLGSVGTVKDTVNDTQGDLDFSIVNPITGETIFAYAPDMTITKEGPSEATVGSYITFTSTISNVGYLRADNVTLVDYLPAGLTYVSSSQSAVYNPVTRTVTWSPVSIGGLTSVPRWITVQVDGSVPNGTHLTNTFSITWQNESGKRYGPASATKEVIVYTHPTLSISKSGPLIGSPGGTLAFSINATNTGGLAAENVTLVDTLPAQYTYVSSSQSGVYNPGARTVTWNLGSLAAGGNSIVSLTILVNAGVPNNTPLNNNAAVTWKDSGGTSYGPVNTSLTTTIFTTPQLTITKEGPDEATIGSYITFTGTLTNVGGTTATNVILVDYLPDGLTFVSSSNSATYDPVARTITWNLGSVGSGVAITGWVTAQVSDSVYNGSHLINTFSVTWKDAGGASYGPASATKEVVCYTHPTLSINKSGPATGSPGGRLTFTIDVTNSGGLSAQNVSVTDALPDQYTYISSNPSGTYGSGNVIWNLGTLAGGSTSSLSLTVQVDGSVANNTPLGNRAQVTWKDSSGNSFGPASSTVSTTIYTAPLLTITKEGPDEATVGSYITFTGTITNTGGTTAENVVLVDYLPAGLTFVSSSNSAIYDPVARTVTWNLGSIGSSVAMPGWITVQVDGSVVNGSHRINDFSVTWQDGSGTGYGPASATKEVICYTHPTLSISKSGPATGSPGGRLTFTIDVTNSGGLSAQNVTLVDALPDKYAFISSNPPSTLSGGNVIWDLGTLSAGGSASVTLTVQVDGSVANNTPLGNSAMVTWTDGTNSYGPSGTSLTTTIYTSPQLTVTKEGPDQATVGSYITFNGTITNTGGTTAENVVLVDYLPAGLTFVSSSNSAIYDPVARTVTWNLGSIGSSVAMPGWITVQVDGSVVNGSHRINDFSVTWQDGSGTGYGPASATKEVICYTHPTLSISKSGPATGSPGGRLTFTIDVTNSGGLSAQNVTLVDALPDKYAFISSNPPATYSGGNVIWDLGTLSAGGSASATLTVQVDGSVANNTPLSNSAMVTWTDGTNSFGPAGTSLTTTIYTTPQMTITKEGPDEATVGSYITFNGSITNIGGMTADNVTLVDHLPIGLTFISSSDSAVYDPIARTVTWNLGNVGSGVAMPGWLTVQVDGSVPNGSHRINNFSLTWQDDSLNSYGPANASKEVIVYTHPTLSISKSGPATGSPGGRLTFTIDVTNSGGLNAQNVTLVDALPDKYAFISSNPPATLSGGNVIWDLGTLSAGGSASATLTVQVDAGVANDTPLSNSAMVTWTDGTNSFGPAGTSLTTIIYTTPQLTITKEGPDEATVGSYITFTGTMTNVGGLTADNVVLVDHLPTGLTYISSSHSAVYDPVARTVTWDPVSIGSGISEPRWLTVQVDNSVANGSHRINNFSLTWQDDSLNSYGPANASKEVIVYTHPTLSISKSGPATGSPGGRLTFTIDVTNSGGLSAQNVTLVDALTDKYAFISSNPPSTLSGGNVIWDLGTLSAGGSASATLTVQVDGSVANNTPLGNSAVVTWTDGASSFGPTGTSLTTTIYTTPQLTVTKEGPSEATAGSYVTFTGAITNVGGMTADNVTLVDHLPAGLTFVSSSHSAVYDPVARTVTWNLGSIGSGIAIPGWITVQVDGSVANGSHRINNFSLTWQDGSGSSYGPANASKEVIVYTHPTLSISKSGPAAGSPGGSLTFTIDVTNSGGLSAQNVTLTDALPDQYTYVSSNPPGTYSSGSVTWGLGTLAAGGSTSVSLTVQVNGSVANNTPLTNRAMVTWTDGTSSFGPASSSLTTTIYTTPHLVVTKSGPATASPGDRCTYTITLNNASGASALNTTLHDFIPPGMNYISSSDGGTFVSGEVTWNLGTIAADGSRSVSLTLEVDPSTTGGTVLTDTATTTWEDGQGGAYGPSSASFITTVFTFPVLSVTVSGPSRGQCGTDLVFTLSINNDSSTMAADNVVSQYIMPSGCTYITSSSGGTYAGGIVTWSLGSLAAASSRQVTVTISCCGLPGGSDFISTGATVWQYPAGTMHGPVFDSCRTSVMAPPQPPSPEPTPTPQPIYQPITSHSSTLATSTKAYEWTTVNLPNIVVQSASLSASNVNPGSPVTVSAVVANKGTVNGSVRITVYVNGEQEHTYGLTVNSGKSIPVQFAISREQPGTYSVHVNGIEAGTFRVEAVIDPNMALLISMSLLTAALILGVIYIRRKRQGNY